MINFNFGDCIFDELKIEKDDVTINFKSKGAYADLLLCASISKGESFKIIYETDRYSETGFIFKRPNYNPDTNDPYTKFNIQNTDFINEWKKKYNIVVEHKKERSSERNFCWESDIVTVSKEESSRIYNCQISSIKNMGQRFYENNRINILNGLKNLINYLAEDLKFYNNYVISYEKKHYYSSVRLPDLPNLEAVCGFAMCWKEYVESQPNALGKVFLIIEDDHVFFIRKYIKNIEYLNNHSVVEWKL